MKEIGIAGLEHHVLVRFVPHETTEGHNGSDASKEHEEDGGNRLHVDGILQVTEVVWVPPFNVAHQTSEEPAEMDT